MRVITGDINTFDLDETDKGTFDRVMSIEMFEHMKNYQLLIAKINGWLVAGGKLFGKSDTRLTLGGRGGEGGRDNFIEMFKHRSMIHYTHFHQH